MKHYPSFDIAGLTGIRVDPRRGERAVLVLLHGYAMEPGDLAPLAEAMGLPATLYLPRGIQVAEPQGRAWWPVNAERRCLQIERGARDLFEEVPPGREALRATFNAFLAALAEQHAGAPMILAGFSQGGMLATDLILHSTVDIRALVLLSTSRIAMSEWQPRLSAARGLPVFIAHGHDDQDLSVKAGEALRDCLQLGGAEVSWLAFAGGHGIPLLVWREFKRFVMNMLEGNQSPRLARTTG